MIRWTVKRKLELVRLFLQGQDVEPVMAQNLISVEEFHGWLYLYRHNGTKGLSVKALQRCVR